MNEKLSALRKKAMNLPLNPGVYLMKDKKQQIIYIGKAKLLKNRVSQYFGSQNTHTVKVRKMVENVDDFDYILTDTELEALVLECSLIKQHSPKYNILLKDAKGYSYIKITKPPWGRISSCFRKDDDSCEYLGPFTSGYSMRRLVEEANKIYKLPTCNRQFPRDIGKGRACLNFYIGCCCAPCIKKVNEKEYDEILSDAVEFLKGGHGQQLRVLKKQMQEYSDKLEFEKAAVVRDRINSMEKLLTSQKVISDTVKNQDVFAIVQNEEKACINVLRFNKGVLYDSEYFIIECEEDLEKTRYELIMNYYNTLQREIPPRITVDGETESADILSSWLSEKAGRKVTLGTVQRGEQVSIMAMCRKNAAERLAQHFGRKGSQTNALDELKTLLGLKKTPEFIEAYDISHTAGSDNVGAMVVFKNGLPYKKYYKKFAVKGFSGQDDYASMAEVIERRFSHYFGEGDEGFKTLPDLILLDGGLGQINAVRPVLEKNGLSQIPLFGMVKDDKHKTRAIASGGGEISISSKRQAFTLVSSIQDEVHRFAITYHKKKHTKNSLITRLTDIDGIGEKKAAILLKHFKTVKAIASSDVDTISKVGGITRTNAENIYKYFNGDEKNDKM